MAIEASDILSMFNDPLIMVVIVVIIGIVLWVTIRRGDKPTDFRLWYFAEIERMITPHVVKDVTMNNVNTKDGKYFWRRAKSWLWKKGNQTLVVWLAKVGKGITYRLETNKEDKDGNPVLEKIGSLYEGIINCLQVEELNELTPQTFTPESLKLLKESTIFVCVDLEPDPSDIPDDFNEDRAVSDSNKGMMDLVGQRLKEKLSREDWIRNMGLIAVGVAGTLILQGMGLIPAMGG